MVAIHSIGLRAQSIFEATRAKSNQVVCLGKEALELARAEDKPIFLSMDSACHWCDVMERESYESPMVASTERYIPIKVDREEADLDRLYMPATES